MHSLRRLEISVPLRLRLLLLLLLALVVAGCKGGERSLIDITVNASGPALTAVQLRVTGTVGSTAVNMLYPNVAQPLEFPVTVRILLAEEAGGYFVFTITAVDAQQKEVGQAKVDGMHSAGGVTRLTTSLGEPPLDAGVDAARPDAARPDAARLDMPKPDVAKPDVPRPDAARPDAPKPDAPRPDTIPAGRACLVTEYPNAVNESCWSEMPTWGLATVAARFGWQTLVQDPSEASTPAYVEAMDRLILAGCTVIITPGFQVGQAAAQVATANPTQKIESLDYVPDPPLANVWAQTYATNEAAFLAGYVAAGTSKTGKVALFGGMRIQPVLDFMDGFVLGVRYYNQVNSADVVTLGWDPDTQTGVFTDSFGDKAKGKAQTEAFLAQGADIIFPVAGETGYGAIEPLRTHGSAYVIGVDTDWAAPMKCHPDDYSDVILTSVVKKIDESVVTVVQAIVTGTFSGGTKTGTLKSGEVDMAPFHQLESKVPDKVKADLPGIRQGIMNGTIRTKP